MDTVSIPTKHLPILENINTCILSCGEHGGPPDLRCNHNGQRIQENAERNFCPHPHGSRFLGAPTRMEMKGFGDVLEKIAKRLGIRKRTGKNGRKGCGCEDRQKMLNKRFAGMWEWISDWKNIFYCPECNHKHKHEIQTQPKCATCKRQKASKSIAEAQI